MIDKAIIVDDESMIRYGLSSCIAWQEEELELIGEANNGESALEIIKAHGVDIIVTDIKMPKMDGLELIYQSLKLNPRLKAILISSYSDFEYARRAVQLGVVVDYLLKPTMEPEDLLRLLRVCKEKLKAEREAEHSTDLYQEEKRHRKRNELVRCVRELMEGGAINEPEWITDEMKGPYLLSIWRREWLIESKSDQCIPDVNDYGERLSCLCGSGVVVSLKNDELALLLPYANGMGEADIRTWQEQLAKEGLSCTVGMSPPFHSLVRLVDARTWAEQALLQSFFRGRGRCYVGEITQELKVKGLPDPSEDPEWIVVRDLFSKSMAAFEQQASKEALEAIFAYWRYGRILPVDVIRQASSLFIILFSHHYYLKTEEKMQMLMERLQLVRQTYSLEELVRDITERFESFWSYEPQIPHLPEEAGSLHAIQIALSYIQENYRRNLSLQEVADQVHMSKNYFSELFKKKTGFNFIDFLIRLRIYYAKHLLETTTLKVDDVRGLAGFNSPKHFLKLFKREIGQTPAEYRQRMGEGGACEETSIFT